jgi:hypothetical protein
MSMMLVNPCARTLTSASLLATFPNVVIDSPPGLGLPPRVSMDFVPTTVTRGRKGALTVDRLTGFPFPVGRAKVYRVTQTTRRGGSTFSR